MDQDSPNSKMSRYFFGPIQRFALRPASGGIVLFLAALSGIVLANSAYAESYHHFWEQHFGFALNGQIHLSKTLHHWINDGLMAVFFFVVGLELKREIIGGELSNPKKALLPIAAAFGGMLFPALIYLLFNAGTHAVSGWGIPMATDIAFALGVLYLLGDKVPKSLRVFLTALAIADDLGAVLVIAFFYTSEISLPNLGIGFGFLALLYGGNKLGIRNAMFYGIVGIGGVWLFFLMSGVHATIAAVLLAFTIPAEVKINETVFVRKIKKLLQEFEAADTTNAPTLTSEQLHLLESIRKNTDAAMTPLQRLEHRLQPFVTFFVMPVFAFANAGVTFSGSLLNDIASPVALGVAIGLVLGKFIGVVGVSAVLVRLKMAHFPQGMTARHLAGIGLLAAIGFTMSLFVTSLAFSEPIQLVQAKTGIFLASLIGGIVGYILLNKKSN